MKNESYFRIFREAVRLQKEGRLIDGIENISIEDMDEGLLRGYIASALGQEPEEGISLTELAKKALREYEMNKPILTVTGECEDDCREAGVHKCVKSCPFESIFYDRKASRIKISKEDCTGCSECIDACHKKKIIDKIQYFPIANIIRDHKAPVYAAIAPAFAGQFGEGITAGKLRTAFKMLGFDDMVEVAIFADILSIREAVEFDRLVKEVGDFMITSCCCPIWMAMLKKHYRALVEHVTPSVSPMIAAGRVLKKLVSEAKVVFIGPCVAKKAEAKEPDVAGAIDYVMTFDELNEVFKVSEINISELKEDISDCSSKGGRIYARTGGVSQCIEETLEKISPKRMIKLKAVQGNGVKECKELLDKAIKGEIDANFLEGMGCIGGCVGGPKVVIDKETGRVKVNEYGEQAEYKTPVDSLCVLKVLGGIGFEIIDELKEENEKTRIFRRKL
ncbi:iron hydrogenase 1 [Oxobacter pfennigii]|uniref:Iron hydrogenase 1 n=1 Tax=Oxobacter pfennigii TaxID=36849 RepID=A0A0P8WM59_9CLOT|nr:[Fe-Fe] hydrogenase large subunit C-terminal domain-containing protein [Oxobacter pfennigii]KPU43591.1 iron hydrogenase 1 [Oxobacter pfennigii]